MLQHLNMALFGLLHMVLLDLLCVGAIDKGRRIVNQPRVEEGGGALAREQAPALLAGRFDWPLDGIRSANSTQQRADECKTLQVRPRQSFGELLLCQEGSGCEAWNGMQ